MSKQKFNHTRRIIGSQSANVKAIYPGMICRFKYEGKNISDKNPMVLVFWNDHSSGRKLHGVNLNYLTEHLIKMFIEELLKGAGVNKNILAEETDETADDGAGKDRTPTRNQLKQPYTRVKLPTFGETTDDRMMSRSEAEQRMKRLYERVVKRFVKSQDMYRTYSFSKMSGLTVIRYDLKGLLRVK